nr:hypothetical protein [Amycolatopsis camponoti]
MVTSDLALPTLLRRIVEAARDLLGARYAALGVIAPGGRQLAEFVHTGMDSQTVALVGRLPEGKGLLGALIDDPRPIRTECDHGEFTAEDEELALALAATAGQARSPSACRPTTSAGSRFPSTGRCRAGCSAAGNRTWVRGRTTRTRNRRWRAWSTSTLCWLSR